MNSLNGIIFDPSCWAFPPRTLRFVLGTIVGAFTLTGSIIAFLKVLKEVDIVICTAANSGRWSPLLITSDAIAAMRAGTVIMDLAALGGGNCQLTRKGEVWTTSNDVTIIGYTDMPACMAEQASAMFG